MIKLNEKYNNNAVKLILLNSIDGKITYQKKIYKFSYCEKMDIFYDENLNVFKNFKNMIQYIKKMGRVNIKSSINK